jgi:hypothetical protein
MLELDAGILSGEAPVDATAGRVSSRRLRGDLPLQEHPSTAARTRPPRWTMACLSYLVASRLLVAGHLQHSVHRTGRCAAQHLAAPRGAGDGGDAVVCGEPGDQTGQESRSAGHGAAASVTVMDITRLQE